MTALIKIKTIALLLLPLMLACFALLPSAQAFVTDPDETFPNFNTAAGLEALLANTGLGPSNTAYGARALRANTTGGSNVGLGGFALINNIDGNANTAVGNNAMFSNQHGDNNMALGQGALGSNVSGSRNVAMGSQALAGNTANDNTGVGYQALASNTTGFNNTAIGTAALVSKTSGNNNVALGVEALANNPTGGSNTAIGFRALRSNPGSNNIALGFNAGINLSAGSNNIDIGNPGGVFGESSTIRIGSAQTRTFIAGIRGVIPGVANTLPVVIDLNGQLGTVVSSRRFKREVRPMDNASEAIHALKPVTFHYKSDGTNTPQFGLLAEEVAEVNPDLVVRDENGEIYSVRYEAVNAMLLNEFLKEHRKNEQQEATIARQQKQIEALTAGLQKVSAQLEVSEPAPQVVSNP
jgi:hypothetical protein